tara:strand:- start:605 stop:796 length:192 start_codon:yes stop_codon:yes gene_type:complete
MGKMKELAIQQGEQQEMESLHNNHHMESIIMKAEAQQQTENLLYEELLLDKQIKQDKKDNSSD